MHHLHFLSVFGGLSALVAVFASWTALDLFHQLRERQGLARLPWLLTTALAMGGGIWSMHFIAMLGFDPGPSIGYDPVLTALSLALALFGTTLAFFIASLSRSPLMILMGGIVMGLSISAMHYLGMSAIRTNALFEYQGSLVLLSVLIGIGASTAALLAAHHEATPLWKVVSSLALGLAIVGMHYTGMAALTVLPGAPLTQEPTGTSHLVMAFAIAGIFLSILVLAVIVSMLNQRDKLMAIIDAGDIGYWEMPLSSKTPWMSPRARKFLDLPPGASFTAQDLEAHLRHLDPDLRHRAFERVLLGDGEYNVEYHLPQSNRWLHFRGRLLHSRTGKPLKLAGVVIDVTDRHQAFSALETSEHRQRLLINELNHRVKNTLATIQSIAALTARRTSTTEEFMALFESRLLALSDTHNLLTANGWERARLRDLIRQEFRPYAEDQLRMEGPDLTLEAEQSLAMGLILHEMVTNAAKYGALSVDTGNRGLVSLNWSEPDQEGKVHLDWIETGGPTVSAPSRKGFGSRLIETSIKGILRGSVTPDYANGALHCHMTFYPASPPQQSPLVPDNDPPSAVTSMTMATQGLGGH